MSHTPGPWSFKFGKIVGKDNTVIADVYSSLDESTSDKSNLLQERKANADLIAAAPDLLEALKEVLKGMEAAYTEGCLEVPPNIDWFDYSSVTQAYTAIAKATGGNHAQKY